MYFSWLVKRIQERLNLKKSVTIVKDRDRKINYQTVSFKKTWKKDSYHSYRKDKIKDVANHARFIDFLMI